VLAYDKDRKELLTRASGDLHEGTGREVEEGHMSTVDPDCRMIGKGPLWGNNAVVPLLPRPPVSVGL